MKAMIGLFLVTAALAGDVSPTVYPFDAERWEIVGEEFERVEYLGEQALMLRGGFAVLNDFEVQDAVVEFDIAVEEARGFAGLAFRLKDLGNYEHFYIRPHQSGNPDANQYTPVFGGVSAWQLYHGEGFGAPVSYRFDSWMHIKIAFVGDAAAVYIDSDEPAFVISDLKRETSSGSIAVSTGNFAPAWFANVSVSAVPDGYRIPSIVSDPVDSVAGTVKTWQVSNSFESETAALSDADVHSWSVLQAEAGGLVNLAQAPNRTGQDATLIARVLIDSDSVQRKRMTFGYSDKVLVLVNGEPAYSGDNTYMSRDYRYLGTIGYFDSAHIPLRKGRNDIRFIVSESFGGWGVQARFDDLEGISFVR